MSTNEELPSDQTENAGIKTENESTIEISINNIKDEMEYPETKKGIKTENESTIDMCTNKVIKVKMEYPETKTDLNNKVDISTNEKHYSEITNDEMDNTGNRTEIESKGIDSEVTNDETENAENKTENESKVKKWMGGRIVEVGDGQQNENNHPYWWMNNFAQGPEVGF